jgi:hypothetical protein
LPNRKYYLTTKHTLRPDSGQAPATKVSDIDISKLLNFVLFVTFVVKSIFTFWLRLRRVVSFVVKAIFPIFSYDFAALGSSHLPVASLSAASMARRVKTRTIARR